MVQSFYELSFICLLEISNHPSEFEIRDHFYKLLFDYILYLKK